MNLTEAAKNLKSEQPKTIAELISLLFNSRTNTHILHLNTNSYAAHKALNEYYDGIIDLTDALAEEYQGKYGIIKGYSIGLLAETADPKTYLEGVRTSVQTIRKSVFKEQDTNLQNIVDEIVSLLDSTIYKLKFLK